VLIFTTWRRAEEEALSLPKRVTHCPPAHRSNRSITASASSPTSTNSRIAPTKRWRIVARGVICPSSTLREQRPQRAGHGGQVGLPVRVGVELGEGVGLGVGLGEGAGLGRRRV
jgi:hypothetical protein